MTGSRAAVASTVAFAWVATFAFGALMSETLLLYPNIFADVPGSLVRALEFLAVTAPNDVLPPLGAATIGTAAAAVALTLRRRGVRPWTIGAALALVLGELLFSAVWFWPRNTIMFVEGSAVHGAAYLQQVAAEFQAGHWVRVAMGLATAVLAFTGMLRMHREASCGHRRTQRVEARAGWARGRDDDRAGGGAVLVPRGESTPLTGATAVRNRAAPHHPLGTFLCRLRTDDVEAVLAEGHHRTATAYGRVLVDADTPAAAEATLALLDWRPEVQLALVLPRSTAVAPPADPPRPVDGDADWQHVHELFRIDHREEDVRAGLPPRPDAATASAVALRRSLGPAVTYFVAERAGEPVACIAAWPGDDGVGLVEDVFVHPAHRGGGIATDLLRHAVGHARAGGAGAVLIGAEIDDTPKHLYARFGFRPAAVLRSHVR